MPAVRSNLTIAKSVSCTAMTYFAVGLPLAVLPEWVSKDLGFSAVIAGLAISVQYLATIVSRGLVGPMIDTSGPKRALLIGFSFTVGSGVVLLLAAHLMAQPVAALAALFLSRLILGVGESLGSTSSIAWGISRAGADHTPKIISWNGIATYGAIAAGAPVGAALLHLGGMEAVGLALLATGLAGLAFVVPQAATAPIAADRLPYSAVFARILPYGLTLALGAIGFGVLTAFIALFYSVNGWSSAWTAISAFGVAFVVARILFVGSIARQGGLTIAFRFLAIEVAGFVMIWLAPGPVVAVIGAATAGLGFSLVFPALGLIVVDLVPPQNRGAAIGAYSMFTDVALCIAGPVAGVLTANVGYRAPFLFGAVMALAGLLIVFAMMRGGVRRLLPFRS